MQITIPPPPLRGKRPSALLCADKPNGAKAHSSGELKLSSSQVALSYRATVATDAIIPRRPPNLGGEFKVCFFYRTHVILFPILKPAISFYRKCIKYLVTVCNHSITCMYQIHYMHQQKRRCRRENFQTQITIRLQLDFLPSLWFFKTLPFRKDFSQKRALCF